MNCSGIIQCSPEEEERILLEGKKTSIKEHCVALNIETDGDHDKN
jgi:hypothetical protein